MGPRLNARLDAREDVPLAPELQVRPAPFFVCRSALFPIDLLLELTSAAATESATRVERGDPGSWAAYACKYDEELTSARTRLWQATTSKPFLRALAVCNLAFAQRLERKQFSAKRNKAARHLDVTLYRYLSRATYRTEPSAAWAGVSLGRWADGFQFEHTPARVHFSPDLSPFVLVLHALKKKDRYRRTTRHKLVPYAVRDG